MKTQSTFSVMTAIAFMLAFSLSAGAQTNRTQLQRTTTFVAVTGISGVPTTATAGTPLPLTGTVNPATATNKTITWSVTSAGTTGANISGNTLTTTAAGTVTVLATVKNGQSATADYVQKIAITVGAAAASQTIKTMQPVQQTQTPQVQQTPQAKVVAPPKATALKSSINDQSKLKILKKVVDAALAFYINDETVVMEKNSIGAAIDVHWGQYKADDFVWESSCNGSIVTVDTRGNVKPKDIGITNIILTSKDGTLRDECKVYVVDKFFEANVGKGINGATAEMVSGAYIRPSAVLDVDLMQAKGRWQRDQLVNDHQFEASAGESASEVIKKFNTKNKVSYSGFFSASAEVNFSSSSQVNRASGFVRAQGQIRVKNENITGSLSPANLKEFVTPHFIDDLNNLTAKAMLENYGSHVIAKCYIGGVVQLDFTHSSQMCSSSEDLEIIVKASAFGVNVSSANNLSTMKTDFESKSSFKVKNTGGQIAATNLEDFYQKYESWKNSVIYGNVQGGPTMCGIDEWSDLIPIWEFAKLYNPAKAKLIEEEFDNQLATNNGILKGIKAYPWSLKDIYITPTVSLDYNVLMNAGAYPFPHIVLKRGTDMNNSTLNSAQVQANRLLTNGSNGSMMMGYAVEQFADIKGSAISDIVICSANGPVPSEYTLVGNLPFGCGGNTYYLYQKKATKDNDWVIDFIGGYELQSSTLPALPESTDTRRWKYVILNVPQPSGMLHIPGSTYGSAVNLAQGCSGNKYIRLIVRQVKASQ